VRDRFALARAPPVGLCLPEDNEREANVASPPRRTCDGEGDHEVVEGLLKRTRCLG